ncbi:MAG TPA: hypothetical protein PLW48_09320 [Alphaproteobacteria bacterium]|nr:hypothetical protein [Alphaproteobacteria bacterium]
MTDFRDSGLPNNPEMFKAYLTYRQNIENLPEEIRAEEAPLKVARIISEHTADDKPVILALLGLMPESTWGLMGKRFGGDIAESLEESRLHVATGYAYLRDASPLVKQITMAGAIKAFEKVEQGADEMAESLSIIRMSGQAPMNFKTPVVLITDTYAKIRNACEGTSGMPGLEATYAEKFERMKYAQADMIGQMAELGIFIAGMPPGAAPAEIRYPTFEESGLMDTPKVRAAYDVLTTHTRVRPEDFEGAIYAAQLLSTTSPTKNPTAIAAALIDIGIREMSPYDSVFLQKKLDWDVLEVLNTATVYQISHPQQVLGAPIEFRQVAVANAIAVMDDAREGGKEFMRVVAENPEYPKGNILQNMLALKRVSIMSQQLFAPALGRTDMPELDRLFADKLKELNQFIDANMPEQKAPAPKPSERKPKPDNDGPKAP